MGVWAKGTNTIKRDRAGGQRAPDWRVLTDTLQSIGPVFVEAYQYRLTLLSKRMGRTPTVGAIYVTASNSYRNGEVLVGSKESLWVEDLSVPVIASISWKSGRLTGTPIPASSGHLLAIRRFTAAGNVIVNDPAAGNNSGVRGSTNATSATRRGSSLARAEWHTSCAPRAGPSLTATSPVGAGSQAVAAPLLNH